MFNPSVSWLMLFWYRAGWRFCQLHVRCTVGPNLAWWLFPHSLTLIKAYSVSKWLEVFRFIFACVKPPFPCSCYKIDWCFYQSALYIFRQGKYNDTCCQWMDGRGAVSFPTLMLEFKLVTKWLYRFYLLLFVESLLKKKKSKKGFFTH